MFLEFIYECLGATHFSISQLHIVFPCTECELVFVCIAVSCLLNQHVEADYRKADNKRDLKYFTLFWSHHHHIHSLYHNSAKIISL